MGVVHIAVFTAAAVVLKLLLHRGHTVLLRALEINRFTFNTMTFALELN
jgi:hypothetical protein